MAPFLLPIPKRWAVERTYGWLMQTPKGTIETWQLSDDPKATVTYRSFSRSGGATIDYNDVDGLDMKRFHIPQHGN